MVTAAHVEGAGAAVLVALRSVVGASVRRMGCVAGLGEMPQILRRLSETGSHQPDETQDEKAWN